MTTVDSHHHLWPLDVIERQPWRPGDDAVLRRAFESAEFENELDASDIDGSIVMQSVDARDENDRLAAYAASSDRVFGWVGFADLPDPERASDDVDELLSHRSRPGGGKLVGVRCLVGANPMEWAFREEGIAALRVVADAGLAWDTVPITDEQVEAVAHIAEQVPSLRIVVDHLASPPMTDAGLPEWRERIRRLANHSNIAIKLSVGVAILDRWDRWDADALRPYVEAALDAFGPERAMLASNWPVVLLRASHQDAWRGVVEAIADLPPRDRALIEGGTALSWYGIDR